MENKIPDYYIGEHYGIHAEKVIRDFNLNYNTGVAVAYLLRLGKKPDNPVAQELKKAIHHLTMELEFVESQEKKPKKRLFHL